MQGHSVIRTPGSGAAETQSTQVARKMSVGCQGRSSQPWGWYDNTEVVIKRSCLHADGLVKLSWHGRALSTRDRPYRIGRKAATEPREGRPRNAGREDGNTPPRKVGAWIPRAAARRPSRTEIEGIGAASGASVSAQQAYGTIHSGSFPVVADNSASAGIEQCRPGGPALPSKKEELPQRYPGQKRPLAPEG